MWRHTVLTDQASEPAAWDINNMNHNWFYAKFNWLLRQFMWLVVPGLEYSRIWGTNVKWLFWFVPQVQCKCHLLAISQMSHLDCPEQKYRTPIHLCIYYFQECFYIVKLDNEFWYCIFCILQCMVFKPSFTTMLHVVIHSNLLVH